MKKALLVIDMQNICVGKNHSPFFNYPENIVKLVNDVIINNKGNTIIYIKNLMKRNLINKFAPFEAYEGTENVELVDSLKVITNYIFDKYTGDAFSNKKLIEFLNHNEINTVEVIGVDGGGCVSLTAVGALKNGFDVIVNTTAIGTMFNNKKDKYFKKLKDMGAKFI